MKIFKWLISIINFCGAMLVLVYLWIYYSIQFRKKITPIFNQHLLKNDGTIEPKLLNRIKFFAHTVPSILGYSFSLIRNKKLNPYQKNKLLVLGASTPLFDDFFDDKNLQVQRLQLYYASESPIEAINTKESLFFSINNLIINDFDNIKKHGQKILQLQLQTQEQSHSNKISETDLRKITFDKGAYSALFYLYNLNEPVNEAEHQLIYQCGAMMQYTDDIFDLWFDLQNNVQTLATRALDFTLLKKDFEIELQQIVVYCHKINTPTYNKRLFIQTQMVFHAATMVALEQLCALDYKATESNSFILLNKFTRKQLVCDMALLRNQWRWFRHYLRLIQM